MRRQLPLEIWFRAKQLEKAGLGQTAIAAHLGIAQSSVSRLLRPRSKGPQKRSCLKCDRDFASQGPANRICPHCRLLNQDLSAGLG